MRRFVVTLALIAFIAFILPAAFALDPTRDIVDRAREYVGCAYSRGGTRPPEFDCSGFVGYVMRPYVPALPRLSHDMAGFGMTVDRAALLPGDLVFFATTDVPGAVSHVAIFIGDGSIIHAISDGPERGVRVTPLDARYWKTHYHSAKRVLSEKDLATAKTDTAPAKADTASAKADTAPAKADTPAMTKPAATAKAADTKPPVVKADATAKAQARKSSPWDTWDGYVMGDYAQWKEAERAKLEAQEKAYDKDKEKNDFEAWKKANGE